MLPWIEHGLKVDAQTGHVVPMAVLGVTAGMRIAWMVQVVLLDGLDDMVGITVLYGIQDGLSRFQAPGAPGLPCMPR